MITDIDTGTPLDTDQGLVLDDVIKAFKQNVFESFPNIDSEVGCTGAQLNQLEDNNFDSTLKELGAEVVKLSGAEFTDVVINADGDDPQFPNQLVTKAYVDWAINEVWGSVTYEDFIISAVDPLFYWPLQEASGPTATDLATAGLYDGTYSGTGITYEQENLVPSESGRKSVEIDADPGNAVNYVEITGVGIDYFTLPFSFSFTMKTSFTPSADAVVFAADGFIEGELTFPYRWRLVLTTAGKLSFDINVAFSGQNFITLLSTEVVNDGQPHLVICSYDYSTLVYKIWIDGVLTSTVPTSGVGSPADPFHIYFGHSFRDAGSSIAMSGKYSDVWIMNKIVTDSGAAIIYSKWLN